MPPKAPTRSAMFTKPWPRCAPARQVEAGAVVGDLEQQRALVLADGHRDRRALARVLARVLQRLEAAEVDRGLDLLRVAADRRRPSTSVGSTRAVRRPRRSASAQAAVHQQRRVDAVREVAQLLHRLLEVARRSGRASSFACVGVAVGELAGEPHAHRERDEVLLRAVVQVALDPAPLGVGRLDDAGARDARSSSAWRRTSSSDSCSAESSFTLCSASPTWRASSVSAWSSSSSNGIAPSGAAHDDQPEQLARVRRPARRASRGSRSVGDERRQPHLRPRGPGHAGARDDGLLLGAERRAARGPRSGTDTARSSRRRRRVHTSATSSVHRLLQRLGELQQQLVERERARQAAAEGPQHLVGRVPLAVDAPRRDLGRAARAPGPTSSAASAAASIDSPSSVRSSPVGRRPEPEHDEQVRRADEPERARRATIVCTSSRSIRIGGRRDAPSASDDRHHDRAAHGDRAARMLGQSTSASSTSAATAIAVAVSAPHTHHCSRGRSCTVARWQRATKPMTPTTTSNAPRTINGVRGRSGRSA